MEFKAMVQEEIIKTVDWYLEHKNYSLIITLIDGTSICGFIDNHKSIYNSREKLSEEEMKHEQVLSNMDKAIVLSDWRQFKEKKYYIPFNKIAGITTLSFSQKEYYIPFNRIAETMTLSNSQKEFSGYDLLKKIELDMDENLTSQGVFHINIGFYDALLDNLYIKCRKRGFLISMLRCAYRRIEQRPFTWGELKADTEYPMYVDWEYIKQISGGLNSIGVGIMTVSGSVSWQQSLYSYRQKLMDKSSRGISSIGEKEAGSVVTNAYIDHVDVKNGKKQTIQYEYMDGEKWLPVILSEEPIRDERNLQLGKWCVGYMKEKCMTVPKIAFEATQSPLKIQGEIVPIPLSTSFGNSKFIIKIRNISSICFHKE